MNGDLECQTESRVKVAHGSMRIYLNSLSGYDNLTASVAAKCRYLRGLVEPLALTLATCLHNPQGPNPLTLYTSSFEKLLAHFGQSDKDNPWFQDPEFRKVQVPVPCYTGRSVSAWEITSMGVLVDMHLGSRNLSSQDQMVTIGMIGGLILSLDKGRRDLLKRTLEEAPNFRELALTILGKSE